MRKSIAICKDMSISKYMPIKGNSVKACTVSISTISTGVSNMITNNKVSTPC